MDRSHIVHCPTPWDPNKIATVALKRSTGAHDLRSVTEEVLERVRFDVEAGVRYVVTEATVRGRKPVRRSLRHQAAPLNAHLWRRLRVKKSS